MSLPSERAGASPGQAFFRWRAGVAVGVTLFTVALSSYSSAHPAVLRWSTAYSGVMLVAASCAAAAWTWCWRRARAPGMTWSPASALFDLAVLSAGLAYLVSAAHTPVRAGDLLDGNILGSDYPAAALLGALPVLLVTAALLAVPVTRRLVRRHAWLLSIVTLLPMIAVAEAVVRMGVVLAPEVQAFPTHRTAMWLARYATPGLNGFRDGTHGADAIGPRLLIVGDSYAFGWGIEKRGDRLGERLAAGLDSVTADRWESFNVSRPDLDTRAEIALIDSAPPVNPTVAVVVYVFNDMDYLAPPKTHRSVFAEAPEGLLGRINPARILFLNSFLAQETYVRLRHIGLRLTPGRAPQDSYGDSVLVAVHLRDVCQLVKRAAGKGIAGLVPLDIAPVLSPAYGKRMERFTRQANRAGIPVWRVDTAFAGHSFEDLVVNSLDAHPNELAHQLAARALVSQLGPILRKEKPAPEVRCNE